MNVIGGIRLHNFDLIKMVKVSSVLNTYLYFYCLLKYNIERAHPNDPSRLLVGIDFYCDSLNAAQQALRQSHPTRICCGSQLASLSLSLFQALRGRR